MVNRDKKKPRLPKEGGWRKRIGSVLWFVVGTVFGLFVQQWFIALLPGPHVSASVGGLHSVGGNDAGCTSYLFTFRADDPVEYVYAKLQFPSKITSYKVGLPSEAETPGAGRSHMQVWELGRDVAGQCTVVQSAINNEADVQSSAAGNVIAIHASKLPAKTVILGMIATSDSVSTVNPSPNLYTEGAYEYPKLGQMVRKSLTVEDRGVTTAK